MLELKEFRNCPALSAMLTFQCWSGGFTASDRDELERSLADIRSAMCQPVGTHDVLRGGNLVSDASFERAVMNLIVAAMALWLSGKLDEVEVDDEEE